MGNCVRRNDSTAESNARVLAVAWLTLPWGAIASFGVYRVVMWWQGLNISEDYASSMGVLGKIQIYNTFKGDLFNQSQFLLFVKAIAYGSKTHLICFVTLRLNVAGS